MVTNNQSGGLFVSLTQWLRDNPLVRESEIWQRTTMQGDMRWVVYLAPHTERDEERIRSQWATQPESAAVDLVFLSHLPRTAAGQVDREQLKRLPVITPEVMQRATDSVRALPGVKRAATLAVKSKPARQHLDTLRPAVPTATGKGSDATNGQISERSINSSTVANAEVSTKPALVVGAELKVPADAPQTLAGILQKAVREVPQKQIRFLETDGRETTLTYRELLTEAQGIAAGLHARGIGQGNFVILQIPSERELLPAFWGCVWLGAVPLICPVPPVYNDNGRLPAQLRYLNELLGKPQIIATKPVIGLIEAAMTSLGLTPAQLVNVEACRTAAPLTTSAPVVPSDAALMVLTSGSTGNPKVVQLTHDNLLTRARGTNAMCGFSGEDRIFNWLPFDHIGTISDWHIRCVELGCEMVYAAKESVIANPLRWLELMEQYEATHSWAPNFAYAAIVDQLAKQTGATKRKWNLSRVARLLTGGEFVSPTVIEKFLQAFAPFGLRRDVFLPAFGMAEMGSGNTYHVPSTATPYRALRVARASLDGRVEFAAKEDSDGLDLTSLGGPIPGTSIRIANAAGETLPERSVGRFQVSGPAVFAGYYRNDETNKQVFVGQGWFDTGDVGFIENGELFLTGRAKDTIIINGANFNPAEIESVVEALPGISSSFTCACAVRVPGVDGEQLAIFFHTPLEETFWPGLCREIRGEVARKLGIKPHYLLPVAQTDIPKTAIGKIQRAQLAKAFNAGRFQSVTHRLEVLQSSEQTVPECAFQTAWQREELPDEVAREIASTAWLVLSDEAGLTSAVMQQLPRPASARVIWVKVGEAFERLADDQYALRPADQADNDELIRTLTAQNCQIDAVLDARNCDTFPGESALDGAVCLLRALDTHLTNHARVNWWSLTTETVRVQDGDIVAASNRVLSSGLRVAMREFPWLRARVIDFNSSDIAQEVAQAAAEIQSGSGAFEVAYRQRKRFVNRLAPVSLGTSATATLPFKSGGVYVVSIGSEAFTREIAQTILQHGGQLVLAGTTQQRVLNKRLVESLTASGAKPANQTAIRLVELSEGDWTDADTLAQKLNVNAATVAGVLHLAGLSAEIEKISDRQHAATTALAARMRLADALAALSQNSAEKLFIAFSSVAAETDAASGGWDAAMRSYQDGLVNELRDRDCAAFSYAVALAELPNLRREAHTSDTADTGHFSLSATQAHALCLAALAQRVPELSIGLDQRHFSIANRLTTPVMATNLQVLYAAETPLSARDREQVRVVDGFGLPVKVELTPLREPVRQSGEAMELWPSVAEYFVYDELIYHALTNDHRRNESYLVAIRKLVPGKIVVDIGTGKEAILSRLCVSAGAKKVYAIEIGDTAYAQAKAKIAELGLTDKIEIIHGNARDVRLPELADVCISEIVGPIGGCEGASLIINDSRHLLKPDGAMIPNRSTTRIAAITCPDAILEKPGFKEVPGSYTRKIFAEVGQPFDLRVCLKKFPRSHVLTQSDILEDVDFEKPIELNEAHPIRLEFHRAGRFDGFLAWLQLHTMPGEVIDIIEHEYSWLPVYFPIFSPGVMVQAGDVIEGFCERRLSDNGLNPDYFVYGKLIKRNGETIPFRHDSWHHAGPYRGHPFFDKLFAQNTYGFLTQDALGAGNRYLPEFPLDAHGEIQPDILRALAEGQVQSTKPRKAPVTRTEQKIAAVWREVLSVDEVGVDDNFFEQGGHSLLLVQAEQRLREAFQQTISLVELFKYPTISSLATYLDGQASGTQEQLPGKKRAEQRSRQMAANDRDVAVIGMSCRFPGASDVQTFWKNLRNGVESISFFSDAEVEAAGIDPRSALHPDYVKASTLFDGADSFDAGFFDFSAREAELMDPQQRVFLECCWEAMEDAGYNPRGYEGSVGIYAGASMNTYLLNNVYPQRDRLDAMDDLEVMTLDSMGGFQFMVANDKDYLTTRASYKLNLRGPSVNVQTACSTTLVTIHMGVQSLLSGESDMVLVGGVAIKSPLTAGHLYQEGMIVSPDGHCRAFDEKAQGTIFGNGCGVVLLKPLADAIRDGDHVYAVVKGSAVNNDGGTKVGFMAPNGEGQSGAISEALAVANVPAESIGYIETHGTGTPMGDPIEVGALTRAFREETQRKTFCPIGSVKTNVGHLQIASGVVGFIKTVLMLQHKEIPPSLHFKRPNPAIDFANSPFYVNTQLTEWKTPEGTPRRAGVNSLGIGGTNCHVILEEAPATVTKKSAVERPRHLVTLSARSEAALLDLARKYENFFEREPEISLADVGFTTNTGRCHFEHRLALSAGSVSELQTALRRAARALQARELPTGTRATGSKRIAFVFSGQGAQTVGMGRSLYQTQPVFRDWMDRCDAILRPYLAKSLIDLLYHPEATQEALDQTAVTQPVLFALEYALAKLWQSWGIQPDAVMGHSLGEYVAACLAGVFSLEDGLRLVAERARLMQALPAGGGMAAVFASVSEVEKVLATHGKALSIAATNAPENVVISGDEAALEKALQTFTSASVRNKRLRVSHAFHSARIEAMLPEFERLLRSVPMTAPKLDLNCNLTGELANESMATPEYWLQHARQTVRCAESIEAARKAGVSCFLELGPKPTLTHFVSQTLDDASVLALPSLRDGREDWDAILEALGQLYQRGWEIDWAGFDRPYARQRVALPTYAFQRKRYWMEAPGRKGKKETAAATEKSVATKSLLGQRLALPLLKEQVFQNRLDARQLAFLRDHKVFGKPVVPGAAYVAMALEAARKVRPAHAVALSEVIFHQALALPEDGACDVQLVLSPTENSGWSFRVARLHEEGARTPWTLHASGQLAGQAGIESLVQPEDEDSTAIQARCSKAISAESFYTLQASHSIELGPSYQWLREIRRGEGEAWAQIEMPASLGDELPVPPGLIDACFGLLVATVDMPVAETLIPFRVDAIEWHGFTGARKFWAHSRLQFETDTQRGRLVGNISLHDESGRLVLALKGLEGRLAAMTEVLKSLTAVDDTLPAYQVHWVEQPLPLSEKALKTSGAWLVFENDGAGRDLVTTLEQRGARVIRVSPGESPNHRSTNPGHHLVYPFSSEAMQQLLTAALPAGAQAWEGIIFAWRSQATTDAAWRGVEKNCAGLLSLTQALAVSRKTAPARLSIVTFGAQPVGADASGRLRELFDVTLWGFARAVQLEQSDWDCRCVDLSVLPSESERDDFVDSLLGKSVPRQYALRGASFWVPQLAAAAFTPVAEPLKFSAENSYVITGGTGALGLGLAEWLVKQGAKKIALISRRAPNERTQTALKKFSERGADVRAFQADVSDMASLQTALGSIETTLGQVRGIIHTAGVLADAMLADQKWDQFSGVLDGKAKGAWNLHRWSQAQTLDFFVLFSSAASVLGNAGQTNYATANAFLDGLAAWRHQHDQPVTCVQWGPWEGDGMASAEKIERRFQAQGIRTIEREAGWLALEQLIVAKVPVALVFPCDWDRYAEQVPQRHPLVARLVKVPQTVAKDSKASASGRAELQAVPEEKRRERLAELITESAGSILSFNGQPLVSDQPLTEQGLDSLMAVELRNTLNRQFGLTLPVSLVFNHPTLVAIAEVLANELGLNAPVEKPAAEKAKSDNLKNLDQLSEQELMNLLEDELK